MKKYKLDIKKSIKRLNIIQIISIILLAGITGFTLLIAIFTSKWIFWGIIEGITIIILSTIFYTLGNSRPFFINKINYSRMYIMGRPQKRKMVRSYVSNLPFSRKLKFTQLVHIREYRSDGTLYKEVPMKNGSFHGKEKVYSNNGNLTKIRSYKKDDLDGVSINLSKENIAIKKTYEEAQLDGISKEFDENTGNLIQKIPYKDDKKHGIAEFFDSENGQITNKVSYKEGKKNGKEIIYRENGDIKEEREYKQNKLNGTLTQYYKSGKIKSKTEFKDEKKHGVHKEFYKNGEIKKLIHYINDEKHGKELTYNKDGNKISETEYKEGEVVGEPKYFASDGTRIN